MFLVTTVKAFFVPVGVGFWPADMDPCNVLLAFEVVPAPRSASDIRRAAALFETM